ncbi:hypothetical protein [Sphingobacterium chungjuense]|uniref:hypothetical protein n=1 Tax=Sphingobacterium chungjuense TaxID=2675553 RepID=UPI00140B20CD|nr:hypothetical protein [Sphingobacterium chungjuense]
MRQSICIITVLILFGSCSKKAEIIRENHELFGRWQHLTQQMTVIDSNTKDTITPTYLVVDFTEKPFSQYVTLKASGEGYNSKDNVPFNHFKFSYDDVNIKFSLLSQELLVDASLTPSGMYTIQNDTLSITTTIVKPANTKDTASSTLLINASLKKID